MSTGRKSFSERVRATSFFRKRSNKPTEDTVPEMAPSTPPEPPIASDSQLGLFGEDLQMKGEQVGKNLAALLVQSLYRDQELQAPRKSKKPSAETAEAMILEAFGSGNDIITRVPFQPTMIAFVEGIINALQHQGVKEDMEHYATRWAAQSINAAADNLQKKGEQIGNMVLDSVAKKVHKSKPARDQAQTSAGPSISPPAAVAEGKAGSKLSAPEDALHVEARIWPFTSKKEETGDDDEDDELCVDPKSCGVKGPKPKRSFSSAEDDDEDPDLTSLVLSPVLAGFNRVFKTSTGVAKRIFSLLSMDNIRDTIKFFLYDKYIAFLQHDVMDTKLKSFGASAAGTILEHLASLDEDEEEPGNDEAVVRAAARNESCADIELLPPLVEPILGGVLAVLKSSEYRGKRLDAVWSLTKWWCCSKEDKP